MRATVLQTARGSGRRQRRYACAVRGRVQGAYASRLRAAFELGRDLPVRRGPYADDSSRGGYDHGVWGGHGASSSGSYGQGSEHAVASGRERKPELTLSSAKIRAR